MRGMFACTRLYDGEQIKEVDEAPNEGTAQVKNVSFQDRKMTDFDKGEGLGGEENEFVDVLSEMGNSSTSSTFVGRKGGLLHGKEGIAEENGLEGHCGGAEPAEDAEVGDDGLGDDDRRAEGQMMYALPPDPTYGTTEPVDAEDEEEEDIDIVEVDEEEEAKVKQAMGVGEGMPVGEEYVEEREGGVEEGLTGSMPQVEVFSNGESMRMGRDEELPQALEEAEAAAAVGLGLLEVDEAPAAMVTTTMMRLGKEQNLMRDKRKSSIEHEEDVEEAPSLSDVESARPTRQRTARPPPQKKKRLWMQEEQFQQQDVTEEHMLDMEVDTNLLERTGFFGEVGEPPAAAAKLRRASKMASIPATLPGSSAHFRNPKFVNKAGESIVKFAIKSFTVPELMVTVPESSTVGQLKKAVTEAVMKLLGGGLRLRVLLQGKHLQDEDISLMQAGISKATPGSGDFSDSLDFMLEPSPLYSLTPGDNDPLLVLSQATEVGTPPSIRPAFDGIPPQPQSTGLRSRSRGRSKGKGMAEDDANFGANASYYAEPSEAQSKGRAFVAPSHTTRIAAAHALAAIRAQAEQNPMGVKMEGEAGVVQYGLNSTNGAIVLHASMQEAELNAGAATAMAIVTHARSRNGGMALVSLEGRRRIRRPFTVSEVVALVDAVEKLGTGRWREVKLRAFSHSKHRTYVDLKDKWKTLVHTAQIAPHQRRGEPVPQELLERVTRAHAYWTAQLREQRGA